MFIGFIYFLIVTLFSAAISGFVESRLDKAEKEEMRKKNKEISKLKEVNRYWFNINVK